MINLLLNKNVAIALAIVALLSISHSVMFFQGKESENERLQPLLDSCRGTVLEMQIQSKNALEDAERRATEAQKNAEAQIEILNSDTVTLRNANNSLRNAVQTARDRAKACATGRSEDAGKAADMLANVLQECIGRREELAEYTDKLIIAHNACLSPF